MGKTSMIAQVAAEVVCLGTRRWPNSTAVSIGTGSPVLNRALHSFVNVAAVAACKVAAEDAFHCLTKGGVSNHKPEHSLKRICKEGAYWGAAAGAYEAIEYGVERMRGRTDWKNAMIGGTLAGALISAAAAAGGSSNSHRGNKVMKDAIAGGAIATAIELISHRSRVDLGPVRFDDPDGIAQIWERPPKIEDLDPWVMGRLALRRCLCECGRWIQTRMLRVVRQAAR